MTNDTHREVCSCEACNNPELPSELRPDPEFVAAVEKFLEHDGLTLHLANGDWLPRGEVQVAAALTLLGQETVVAVNELDDIGGVIDGAQGAFDRIGSVLIELGCALDDLAEARKERLERESD